MDKIVIDTNVLFKALQGKKTKIRDILLIKISSVLHQIFL